MEEMPEYQICINCGKRGTPNMRRCWNCGTPYPGFEDDRGVDVFVPETVSEFVEDEIETIKPCEIEDGDFCKKLFAYGLLLNGEMELSFCDCDICTRSLADLLAFIMECSPEDEAVRAEIDKIDRTKFRFDISKFGTV
jgi:hypothetical protein